MARADVAGKMLVEQLGLLCPLVPLDQDLSDRDSGDHVSQLSLHAFPGPDHRNPADPRSEFESVVGLADRRGDVAFPERKQIEPRLQQQPDDAPRVDLEVPSRRASVAYDGVERA